MKYIDIHAHTNFATYDSDRDMVIARAKENDVTIINVGTQLDTARKAVDLANQYENCYAIIGLHPIHTTKCHHDEQELGEGNKEFMSRGEAFDVNAYRGLAENNQKVVGFGECGLDYYRNDETTKIEQEKVFRAHIELALELDMPLMLHVRASKGTVDAYVDVLKILHEYKKEAGDKLRGDVHFFAGTIEIARQFLDIGFDMSFTGVITFAKEYAELVKFVPLDRMHAETDSPYVTPVPYRGTRNESLYVIEVVKKIAEIKVESVEVVTNALAKNAKRLWGINL